MKFPLSFYKLVMAAAVALPTMALATITPEAPQQDTDNCYMIGSAAELYGFAEMVNGTGGGFNGCGKLTANIVVNKNVLGTDNANVNADGEYVGADSASFDKWAPINGFAGKFHGQGHTISGLYFNDPEKEKVGLFGSVGNVEIDGLGLVDSYFEGRFFVGGFIGYAEYVNVYIRDSYNSSVMRGHSDGGSQGGVGGFVGALFAGSLEIENSYNLGFVTGERDAGGLVGYISGEYDNYYVIFNSYNRGSVISAESGYAGGFVGNALDDWAWLYVYNSYNAGKVNGGDGFALVGGEYGPVGVDNFYYLDGSANGWGVNYDEKESTPAADFADGTVAEALHDYSGTAENGTAIDGSVWGQGFGRDTLPTLTGAIGFALTLHVYDGVVIDSAYTPDTDLPKPTREGYEFLGWYATSDFRGSAVTRIPSDATDALEYYAKWIKFVDNCYEIASAEDLFSFAAIANGMHGGFSGCGKLTADIVVNENVLTSATGTSNVNAETGEYTGDKPARIWTPIGTKGSSGTSGKPFKGEFHGNGHTISGLYVNSQDQNNSIYKGLFGYVEGEVVIDGVGIVDSYILGFNFVGGLVGGLGNEAVLTISKSYNAGFVGGNMSIGGLVGGESLSLNVTNPKKPSAVKINNSYNLGRVKGSNNVGGLVGQVVDGDISNSYNAGLVSSVSNPIVGSCLSMTITNSYYLGDAAQGASGTNKTAEEFASGTVAKALHDWCEMEGDACKKGGLDGSVWGQDLSKENSLPEFIERLDYRLGSVTFFEKAGKIDSAYVDATSDLAVDFPNDVVVSGPIKFKRTFAGNGYSTIVLPFQPNFESEMDFVSGVNFYAFYYYDFVNQKIQISDVYQGELVANVPYLVQAEGATELVFKNGGTFNTAGGVRSVNLGGMGAGWTIYGTYAYKQWEEGDEGLGKTYGFAGAADNDPAIVGQFAKIGVGAYIYPMRAYLEYVAPAPAGRPAANGAVRAFAANTVASLPDEIDVVIVEKGETGTEIAGFDDASGEQTTRVIGTINTRTGEFKFANDRWFDLNGRYLGNKKPTQKGAYYNNGKKVIVK